MKATMLKTFAFSLLVTTAFSCKKSNSTPSPKSNTELLTQTAWKFDTGGIDMDKNGTIDMATPMDNCDLDDSFVFKADGTGVQNRNTVQCDPQEAATENFTWSFKNNQTVLTCSLTTLEGDANISQLNDASLTVYQDIDNGNGGTLRYIIRFKH